MYHAMDGGNWIWMTFTMVFGVVVLGAVIHALQAHTQHVIEHGDPPARKALLQALVTEIRVVSRTEIYPFFALPVVRPPYGSVPPTRIELVHAV